MPVIRTERWPLKLLAPSREYAYITATSSDSPSTFYVENYDYALPHRHQFYQKARQIVKSIGDAWEER